jgi:hypothetical protein
LLVLKAITINNHEAVVADNNNISNDYNNEPRFIDIGYVSGVHGFQGDVRVKPNTDFPELRFSTVQLLFLCFLCFCVCDFVEFS